MPSVATMFARPLPSGGGPLPQPLVAAVMNDPYEDGGADISVTRLIAPPRQVALAVQYKGDSAIAEDPADRMWSLLGQSVHTILERANVDGIAEKRLYWQVGDWRVSGGFDHLALEPDMTLSDYKVTSVWSVKDALKQGGKHEWEQQLNLLAFLAAMNGYANIQRLQIVALMRDWRKNEKLRFGDDYPVRQVAVIPIRQWGVGEAKAFLEERVSVHQQARRTLPECTPEERWTKPTVYAATKYKQKRALRLFTDKVLAEAFVEAHESVKQERLTLETRPGGHVRCESYCAVAAVCTQWQNDKPKPRADIPESWQPYLLDGMA